MKWIHLGDGGNQKEIILELIKQLPGNIEVIFKGQLTNRQVIDFYKETSVSLFLNVSKSEGIPVSIMEAISFGIPVIATDVGGVREITNSNTGELIPKNFDPVEVAHLIENNLIRYADLKFRNGVRSFWENNFNASKNYTEFISSVLKIN